MKTLDKKGFTLLELMIIVAIIAIMSGLGYSGFTPLIKREKVKAAAFQFAGDVKEARMQAIERHSAYSIAFSEDEESYTVYQGDVSDVKSGEAIPIREVTVSDECPGVSPSYTEDEFPMAFNPAGIISGDSTLRSVRFENENGCWCEVKITAVGGVRIEEDPDCFF